MPDLAELQITINSQQAQQAAKDLNTLGTAAVRTETITSQAMHKVEAGLEGVATKSASTGRIAAAALKAIAGAWTASEAAAAGAEKNWVRAGAGIASAFAVGGPLLGGLALAGTAMGVLTSASREAERAAEQAREAHVSWMKEWKDELAGVTERLKELDREQELVARKRQGEILNMEILQREQELREVAKQADAARLMPRGTFVVPGLDVEVTSAGNIIRGEPTGPARASAAAMQADERLTALTKQREELQRLINRLKDEEKQKVEEAARATERQVAAERFMAEHPSALAFDDPYAAMDNAQRQVEREDEARRLLRLGYATEEVSIMQRLSDLEDERARTLEEQNLDYELQVQVLDTMIRAEDDRLRSVREHAAWQRRVREDAEAEAKAKQAAAATASLVEQTQTLAMRASWGERILGIEKQIAATRGNPDAIAGLERQVALLRAQEEHDTAVLRLEQDIAERRKQGIDAAALNAYEQAQRRIIEANLGSAAAAALREVSRSGVSDEFAHNLSRTLSGSIEDAIIDGVYNGFSNAAGIIQSLSQAILRSILQQTLVPAISGIASSLFGSVAAGALGGGLGGTFTGGGFGAGLPSPTQYGLPPLMPRAEGGPVWPGHAFLVGERGPEVFVPQAAGQIVAQGQERTTVNHLTMYVETPDPGAFRLSQKQILEDARRKLRR